MPAPDSITVEIINPITTVEVSPVEEINQVAVNTVTAVDYVTVDNTDAVTTIAIAESTPDYVVEIGIVDFTSPVQSVNGKTGHVVIDYPDIGSDPVNHVKYTHLQTSISNNWVINHNLNFYPNVTILDNSNNVIEANLIYNNANTVTIVMTSSISGRAYLS